MLEQDLESHIKEPMVYIIFNNLEPITINAIRIHWIPAHIGLIGS